jgi:hypothetical protein
VQAPPSPSLYTDNSPGYELDDPYEGELLIFFCDLFCVWDSPQLRDRVWEVKRAKLQPAHLSLVSPPLTVQRGFWYSAHEVWKVWSMPYLQTKARGLFRAGEAARSINSAMRCVCSVRFCVVARVTCFHWCLYCEAKC